jgi:apolipoprotein N-acyltransferase
LKLPSWLKKPLPSVGSALLAALAFPPANVALLVFIALAPWLAALRDTDGKGALRSGYLFGLVFMAYQMYWLFPFVWGWTGNIFLGLLPWLLSAAIGALYFLLAGWLMHRCFAVGKPWLIPFVWAAVEAFRSYIPHLAFPWGLLANPLWPYPAFIQHAAVGTIFLVSAWLLVPNLLLAQFVWPDKSADAKPIAPTYRMLAIFAAFLVLSGVRYYQRPETQPYVVSVGQPAVPKLEATVAEQAVLSEDASVTLVAQALAQNAELLVLPEGFADGGPLIPPDNPLPNPEEPSLSVLFGGNFREGETVYQSAYLYDEPENEWSYLNKTRLVIFGEYVPLRDQLSFLRGFRLPSGDLTPAQEVGILELDGIRIAPLLCFEALFPDVAATQQGLGANLIAVMAIDDWYEGTPAPEQLMSGSVWRAVESGLPLVRSANSGLSVAIDLRGNIVSALPEGETAAMRVEVGVPSESDALEQRFAFVWLSGLAVVWVVGETLVRRFNKKKQDA